MHGLQTIKRLNDQEATRVEASIADFKKNGTVNFDKTLDDYYKQNNLGPYAKKVAE